MGIERHSDAAGDANGGIVIGYDESTGDIRRVSLVHRSVAGHLSARNGETLVEATTDEDFRAARNPEAFERNPEEGGARFTEREA